MDEKQLRRLIERVKDGKLSRRAFVGRMLALGIDPRRPPQGLVEPCHHVRVVAPTPVAHHRAREGLAVPLAPARVEEDHPEARGGVERERSRRPTAGR